MDPTAVVVSKAGGRWNDAAWAIITALVLDGLSSRHTRRAYSQALDEFLIWFRDDPGREIDHNPSSARCRTLSECGKSKPPKTRSSSAISRIKYGRYCNSRDEGHSAFVCRSELAACEHRF